MIKTEAICQNVGLMARRAFSTDSHDIRVLLRPVLGGLGLERRAVKAKEG